MKRAPKVGWSNGSGSTKFEVEVRTVYELLDGIRKKPGIYVGVPSNVEKSSRTTARESGAHPS